MKTKSDKKSVAAESVRTQSDVSKMTDAEIMIRMARESLARYGTALPFEVLKVTGRKGKKISPAPSFYDNPNWKKENRTCPKCGLTKQIEKDFGIRPVRGVERAQSWCKDCRASTSYYRSTRVNRSKNAQIAELEAKLAKIKALK